MLNLKVKKIIVGGKFVDEVCGKKLTGKKVMNIENVEGFGDIRITIDRPTGKTGSFYFRLNHANVTFYGEGDCDGGIGGIVIEGFSVKREVSNDINYEFVSVHLESYEKTKKGKCDCKCGK